MQTTLEQVITEIRSLPADDQARLREWLDETGPRAEKERQDQEAFAAAAEHSRKIFQWLEDNREQYLGQWVALDGDQLIAHGESAKKVYEQAKAAGVEVPFIHCVRIEELPFGGW
jgi:hypothetical protein